MSQTDNIRMGDGQNVNEYTLPHNAGMVKLSEIDLAESEVMIEKFMEGAENLGNFQAALVAASEIWNKLIEHGKDLGKIKTCPNCEDEEVLIDEETGECVICTEYPDGTCRAMHKSKMTPGGKCRCGNPLPDVRNDETPFQFCSEECKKAEQEMND